MRQNWVSAALGFLALVFSGSNLAADDTNGKLLLEKNCSRCHAIAAGVTSPLKEAPNLWTVLRSYPEERLELELSEGIGSRHRDMPQIQFSSEEITDIQNYLFREPGN
jgi:mono/diheme cytochrome c family protein